MSSTLTASPLLPTYARYGVTFASGDGVWLAECRWTPVPRPPRRHRGRLARPLPSSAARRRAAAARRALAHLEPLFDRADAAARRVALRPLRRRSGVLLQLRRRGDRGGAEVGAEGDRKTGCRGARELLSRTHSRRTRRDRTAVEACSVGAARAGRALRDVERRGVAGGGDRPGHRGDPARAGSG